ncbi:PaaI family thioesterase [Flavonifractor hominis]|uniref:PaaI family thioesterase n=1 Tax=Flavonifractor hominis TaxID=3133178 RepID=A0ABV1ENL2_9FIRM
MLDDAEFERIAKANAFARYNGITIRQPGPDLGEAVLEMGPNSLNPYGALHGGAYYTLADCAGGCACRTDGRRYVTLQGGLNFIHSAKSGTVTACAEVRHRGRTTCLVHVEVVDAEDTLLACGDFTYFCKGTF